jgi:hypothetical protein
MVCRPRLPARVARERFGALVEKFSGAQLDIRCKRGKFAVAARETLRSSRRLASLRGREKITIGVSAPR